MERGKTLPVECVGAPLLAESDRDHLHEAALDLAGEVRVRLDAVDRDDHVGAFESVAVDEDRNPRPDLAQLDRLHAG